MEGDAMSLYRVWCRYEPDHVNMPAGRRGQWRVIHCHVAFKSDPKPVRNLRLSIGILSTKPYPKGCIIRPHKELNRVLAARKAVQ
jgi:hypothetical protein